MRALYQLWAKACALSSASKAFPHPPHFLENLHHAQIPACLHLLCEALSDSGRHSFLSRGTTWLSPLSQGTSVRAPGLPRRARFLYPAQPGSQGGLPNGMGRGLDLSYEGDDGSTVSGADSTAYVHIPGATQHTQCPGGFAQGATAWLVPQVLAHLRSLLQ